MTTHHVAPAFVVAIVAGVSGCERPEPIPTRHPLTGSVLRDEQPVAAGGLIFLPVGRPSGLVVNAHVRPDGGFTAETTRTRPTGGVDAFPGVGEGEYRVFYHPPSDGQKTGLEVDLGTVTVPAGGAEVTLTLPSKLPAGGGRDRDDDPKSPRFNPNRDD